MKVPAQFALILLLALIAGALRQIMPQGIAWSGQWPTQSTSAADAYRMMAKPGDAPFIDLAEVIDKIRDPKVTLIDARSNKEFVEGHLPGSRNFPYYELEKYQDAALEGLEADSEIILYCEGIGCELSFFLARNLQEAGYTNLHIFYGGYPEWKNAGLEIVK